MNNEQSFVGRLLDRIRDDWRGFLEGLADSGESVKETLLLPGMWLLVLLTVLVLGSSAVAALLK